jgi:hypothetical protein
MSFLKVIIIHFGGFGDLDLFTVFPLNLFDDWNFNLATYTTSKSPSNMATEKSLSLLDFTHFCSHVRIILTRVIFRGKTVAKLEHVI